METKLTEQSEAILTKLKEDVKNHSLSGEELIMVRKGLAAYEGLGVLANAVIKAAGFIAAGAVIWNYLPWGTKQ